MHPGKDISRSHLQQSFALGLYDGLTGLVTEPVKAGKKEGAVGVLKGTGRGRESFHVLNC